MNKWGILTFVLVAIAAVYYFFPSSENQLVVESQKETASVTQAEVKPKPTATVHTIGEAKINTVPIPEPPAIERRLHMLTPELRELVEKNNRLAYFKQLAPLFPEDQSGQHLLVMATFLDLHGQTDSAIVKLLNDHKQQLMSNPEEAMLALGIAMKNFGQQFSSEKQAFIHLIGELNIPLEEKRELLMAEGKRALDKNEAAGPARLTPGVVMAVLGNLYLDQGQEKNLYPLVREIVLAHQEDPEIQKNVILEYKRFDRQHSKQLWDESGFGKK